MLKAQGMKTTRLFTGINPTKGQSSDETENRSHDRSQGCARTGDDSQSGLARFSSHVTGQTECKINRIWALNQANLQFMDIRLVLVGVTPLQFHTILIFAAEKWKKTNSSGGIFGQIEGSLHLARERLRNFAIQQLAFAPKSSRCQTCL